MTHHYPISEPVSEAAKPIAPGDIERAPCYPCEWLDIVRLPQGVPGHDGVLLARCFFGYPQAPSLGDACWRYRQQPHLVARLQDLKDGINGP